MATLYKRKGSSTWQIEFTAPDGRRVQKSSGTKDEKSARELAAHIEYETWRQARLKEKPRYKWQDAVTRWVKENGHKRSLEEDKKALRWLDPFLFDTVLNDIDLNTVNRIKGEKAKTAKPETVNRTLAVFRAVMNKAVREWGWLDSSPFIKMLPTTKKRLRWLTKAEATRLLQELPAHLAEMARFSLATGLRE